MPVLLDLDLASSRNQKFARIAARPVPKGGKRERARAREWKNGVKEEALMESSLYSEIGQREKKKEKEKTETVKAGRGLTMVRRVNPEAPLRFNLTTPFSFFYFILHPGFNRH